MKKSLSDVFINQMRDLGDWIDQEHMECWGTGEQCKHYDKMNKLLRLQKRLFAKHGVIML